MAGLEWVGPQTPLIPPSHLLLLLSLFFGENILAFLPVFANVTLY